jgi:Trypsin-co-occurring domain 2
MRVLRLWLWVGEAGMTEDDADGGWVGLTEAIEALRAALVAAWWDGQRRRVRFRVEPVELMMQVGVTRTGKGAAGVRWHVLALGGERSREAATTQTLKLRLAPVLFDEQGNMLAEAEQLISDRDDQAGGTGDAPRPEPE